MRLRSLLAVLPFCLLAACGGEDALSTCAYSYWDGTVGTCLPDGWHALDRATLDDLGVSEEVVAAFQSDIAYAGQYVTVTVLREPLADAFTPEEFSDTSVMSVQTLPMYEQVDQQSVTIDGSDLTLNIYRAQPTEDLPAARFYQVSTVHDRTGYSITAGTPVTVNDTLEEQVLTILEHVSFVQPTAAE